MPANDNAPLVSIVICTYNGEAFIEQQLKSVIDQSFVNLEIVICDDASVDGTSRIIHQFVAIDKRIKFIENKVNIGYNKNFEQGILNATGDFIALCDQDDIWHNAKIEKMLQALKPENDFIYCDSLKFKTGEIDWAKKPASSYRRFEGNDGRKLAIFNTVSGHAVLMRRHFLKKILPFHNGVYYDWTAAITAAYNGGVTYLPEVLVYQRVHTNNASMAMGHDYRDQNNKQIFNKMIGLHLAIFSTLGHMPLEHKLFFSQLNSLWNAAKNKSFSFSLFLFIFQHRDIIFYSKIKRVSFFRHLKYSYTLASNKMN